MEILVHNISHADMILELSMIVDSNTKHITLGRPKFNVFQPISFSILKALNLNPSQASPTRVPVREREMKDPKYAFKVCCSTTFYPVGFRLDTCPIPISSIQDFRLKSEATDANRAMLQWQETKTQPGAGKILITAVYFPLLALLIPKWEIVLQQHESDATHQIIYLVSGVGIPRNTNHAAAGNSTEQAAHLMLYFARQFYPTIQMVHVHSQSDIFKLDANVVFINSDLKRLLEEKRQSIVKKCGDNWKKHFHLTIVYAEGAPARLAALNASLRLYRPSCLHIWQLKTFWHEKKLSLDDVDFHSFENIEASPPIPIDDIREETVKKLVTEMKRYRDQFLEAALSQGNELTEFWLRKTRKPVLSVLVVQKHPDAQPVVYRGLNCEVSMPTGSLCAERNVIGTALAKDPTLRRRDICLIGVLSLRLAEKLVPIRVAEVLQQEQGPKKKRPRTFSCDDNSVIEIRDKNPLSPCGSCMEWLLKVAEANPALRVVTFSDVNCTEIYINQIL